MNNALKNIIRPHYQGMAGYVSAGMEAEKNQDMVFMNANESYMTLNELSEYNLYPEPQPKKLLNLMGDAYGVDPENILITRGADESLVLLTKIFCEPHKDSVLIHKPTFGMYAVNADSTPVPIINVPLIKGDDSFSLNTEAIIEEAKNNDGIKVIYICSPNNPTGNSFLKEDILRIVKAVKGRCVVVLDEAYAEFSKEGGLVSELKNHPNLIVLRTLSKAYALAGIRMGVTLCHDQDFIAFARSKVMDAYPLPAPSIDAAMIALAPQNRDKVQENIQCVLKEKDRLKSFFEQYPLTQKIYQSDANFLLIEFTGASDIAEYCKQNGFVVRDFSSKPETKDCLRISPASVEANDRFMKVMTRYTLDINTLK